MICIWQLKALTNRNWPRAFLEYASFSGFRILLKWDQVSLRKQPIFGDATSGFLSNWCLRNERRNSILMMRHYRDLGGASDELNQIFHAARPIRSTTQIWVVTRHRYGISALVCQPSCGGETSDSVTKYRLFSQANIKSVQKCTKLLPLFHYRKEVQI